MPQNKAIPIGHFYAQLIEGWDERAYIVAWAIDMLERGAASLTLAELAGYTPNTNSFEFNETLKALCIENHIKFDDPVRFLFQLIHEKSETYSTAETQQERVRDIREALDRIEALTEL